MVRKMDQNMEREVARLERVRKKKEARSLLLHFYKKSLFFNANFKEEVAAGRHCVALSPYDSTVNIASWR